MVWAFIVHPILCPSIRSNLRIYTDITLRMMWDKQSYFFFAVLPHLSRQVKSAALNMTNCRLAQVVKVERNKSHCCTLIGNEFPKAKISPERLLAKTWCQSEWR